MSSPTEADVVGAPQTTLVAVGALLEATVRGTANEKLGRIAEVMLSAGKGEIAYVVLARGGVLSVGETLHAVPWADFTFDPEDGQLSLSISGIDLDASGGFDKDHWPTRV